MAETGIQKCEVQESDSSPLNDKVDVNTLIYIHIKIMLARYSVHSSYIS